MEDKREAEKSNTLNLKNFDIVILNYVEESKKDELLKELKELYGEYQPLETGVSSAMGSSSTASPDARFGKRILYYDEVDSLKKPLPEKFQSLEIRILNHIISWCEVICKVRLKQEYLEQGKQEFIDRLEKDNTLSTPNTFEKAHKEFEDYLAPHIMDNIASKQESEKRRSYSFLYLGEIGESPSQKIMDVIKATDYTRSGIGWFAVRWASILERRYLIQRTGGGHSGLLLQDRGFSILNIAPIEESKDPDSWDKDTGRRFRAFGTFGSEIIDNISAILLPYIVLSHRLESVKYWERENISLSHKIQELSDKANSQDYLNNIASLQREIGRHRSEFLSKSFDMQSEYEELSDLIKSASEFLLSRDFENSPIEEPFFHPINAEPQHMQRLIRSGNPKQGVLVSVTADSQFKNEQLLKRVGKIEEGQITLSAYVHDIVNASLQSRMASFTEQNLALNKRLTKLTWWIVALTLSLFVLAVIQTLTYIQQYLNHTTPTP